FLEGKVDFQCTPWGIPSYSIFGWQRPCYLMSDGYAETYQELLDTTDWSKYGRGNDPRCDNCMAHCGYEPTAGLTSMSSLRQSLRAFGSRAQALTAAPRSSRRPARRRRSRPAGTPPPARSPLRSQQRWTAASPPRNADTARRRSARAGAARGSSARNGGRAESRGTDGGSRSAPLRSSGPP